jgi:hypothetical protein
VAGNRATPARQVRQERACCINIQVEYQVLRACDAGHIVEQHVRMASSTRGRIQVRQETDAMRKRTVLVARLVATTGYQAIPALFDVTLVGTSGELWVLSGFERIQAGPLAREHAVGQSWLIEPAPVEDLIKAETQVNKLSGEAHELKQQLRALIEAAQVGKIQEHVKTLVDQAHLHALDWVGSNRPAGVVPASTKPPSNIRPNTQAPRHEPSFVESGGGLSTRDSA